MQSLSLKSVINEIAAHPDQLTDLQDNHPSEGPEKGASSGRHFDLADITPYLGADPLILDLAKDYLNAKADYQAALVEHGQDSPIADIAGDHADSAWCTLQARLYELKQDQAAQARADLILKMEQNTFEAQEQRRAQKLKEEREAANLRAKRRNDARNARDADEGYAFFIMLMLATKDPLRLFGNVFAGPPELKAAWR